MSTTQSNAQATPDDVRRAYQLLLEREPDPEGFELYSRICRSRTLSVSDLVNIFIGSDEFVAKHRRPDAPVEVQLDGYSLFVRPSDHDIGSHILQTKQYEPHVTRVVHEVLRPGNTFVDVGANIGFFTALAAHKVGPSGKVVAIEPMDKNVQLLYATVWRNAFQNVQVFPYAASDAEGLLPMATGPGTSNGQIMLGGAEAKLPAVFAQARRLDDLLADLSFLHLLKIDIEGHELLALRGFGERLAQYRPRLLTEFHPKCMRDNSKIEPADYLAFLFGYGPEVQVLRNNGEQVACAAADGVMREWERADRQSGSGGTAHLDLLVLPYS